VRGKPPTSRLASTLTKITKDVIFRGIPAFNAHFEKLLRRIIFSFMLRRNITTAQFFKENSNMLKIFGRGASEGPSEACRPPESPASRLLMNIVVPTEELRHHPARILEKDKRRLQARVERLTREVDDLKAHISRCSCP
jgi:hypothetical protein